MLEEYLVARFKMLYPQFPQNYYYYYLIYRK